MEGAGQDTSRSARSAEPIQGSVRFTAPSVLLYAVDGAASQLTGPYRPSEGSLAHEGVEYQLRGANKL